MTKFSKDQIIEIENMVKTHGVTQQLSPGQKWDVAWLMSAFVGGAASILGAAGYFLVVSAATTAAEKKAVDIAPSEVVSRLLQSDRFKSMVQEISDSVPSGAVIAFSDKCPIGWSEFSSARGRVLIGAGDGAGLTNRSVGNIGGSETHQLSINELPQHSHQVRAATFSNEASEKFPANGQYGIAQETIISASAGGGEPHNNMPPFIALTFCKS